MDDAERERLADRARHALEIYRDINVVARDIRAAVEAGWQLNAAEIIRVPMSLGIDWIAARLPPDLGDAGLTELLRREAGHVPRSKSAAADGRLAIASRLSPGGMIAAARMCKAALWIRLALFGRPVSRRAAAAAGSDCGGIEARASISIEYAGLLAPDRLTGIVSRPVRLSHIWWALTSARTGLARAAFGWYALTSSELRLMGRMQAGEKAIDSDSYRWMGPYAPSDAAAAEFMRRRRADFRRNATGFIGWRTAAAAGAATLGRRAAAAARYANLDHSRH